MQLEPFKLERYFARYEFAVQYLLSSSDCESLSQTELVSMASAESRALWEDLRLGYTESQGHPQLRLEVSRLYERVPPENVVVAAPEEAIFIAMQTLLSPGDHVIAVAPAYQSLHEVACSIGCSLSLWRVEPGAGKWQLDLNHLEDMLTPKTRLLVLNFPHNPTGFLLPRGDFQAVTELARRHDLYIFSDEMYRLMEFDPAARLPAACDVYEKAITLCGLSKTFALPGLRIGWLAAQEGNWVNRWLAFKDYTTICSSAPSEVLGIIALQNRERIVQRSLEIVGKNLALSEGFFARQAEHFAWFPPDAGSVAFPRWLGDPPVEAFCQDLLEKKGVMLVPGGLFNQPGDYFRLGLGRRNFGEAVARVEEYLKTYCE